MSAALPRLLRVNQCVFISPCTSETGLSINISTDINRYSIYSVILYTLCILRMKNYKVIAYSAFRDIIFHLTTLSENI